MKYASILVTIFSLFAPLSLLAQDNFEAPSSKLSFFNLVENQSIAHVIIETDLDSLINIRKRTNYQFATFTFSDLDGNKISQKIKVKPRGKYRRSVCDFPTLKLNFSKKNLHRAGMAKYDEYKLVTHCLDDFAEGRENVLKEYLVYKMYNLLSENSFRVQLLNITYVDSKNKHNRIERIAFLIEDKDELEDRIDGKIYKDARLPIDSFNMEQYNFVALFQYMVGNVDWKATPFNKNTKTFKKVGATQYELIPYDFDFSGIVSPSYMRLAGHLNQTDSRQRIFLGNIDEADDLEDSIVRFKAKKEAILDLINDFELLPKNSRKDIRKYLVSFYTDIAGGAVNTPTEVLMIAQKGKR